MKRYLIALLFVGMLLLGVAHEGLASPRPAAAEPIAELMALALPVPEPMPAQQATGTNYGNFVGAFAAPGITAVAGASSAVTYTAGTVYSGGTAEAITAGTINNLTTSTTNCTAPAYSSCVFIYWASGSSLLATSTYATASASGNVIVAYVTVASNGTITLINPASLSLAGPGAANPITAGTPIYYGDSGAPVLGTAGTATTGIANQLWYTQLFVPHNFTITNAAVLCGTTCTTDKIAIGIWSTAGTLLAWTSATVGAGTTLSGASTWQKIALTTPYAAAGPGRYIIGVVTSGTNAADIQTAPLLGGVCAVASSQGTLANFTPATTATTNSCPFVYVN